MTKLFKCYIFFLTTITSCQSTNSFSKKIVTNGEYFGSRGLYEMYVRIVDNYALIDAIHIEKRPMRHIKDTILIDTIDNRYRGNQFILLIKKNKINIELSNLKKKAPFLIKMKLDSRSYSKLKTRINEIHFHNELFLIKGNYLIDYDILNEKIAEFKLFEKIKKLECGEFITEFAKFKNSLKAYIR